MKSKLNRNEKKTISSIETIYSPFDIKKGKCYSCSEKSEEILIDDGRCLDCIESDKFFEETMKGL